MILKKNSFTLIEITTVIVIIVIISVAGFFLVGNFMKQGRDAKRYADANTLATALQGYYFNHKDYPNPSNKINIVDQSGTLLGYQGIADKEVVSNGLQITKLPVDPSDKNVYYSYLKAINPSENQKGYEVGTMIENFKDKDEGYKIYKGKNKTPYIINSNTITVCDDMDNMTYPTKLTSMNYKTNEFLREDNTGEGVSIVFDMENLKGSCENEIIAPIIGLSGGTAKVDTGSITLLEVEDYPDMACSCSGIEHAISCIQIYDGEKYGPCKAVECENGYYIGGEYCVLGTGYLASPVPYKNYGYKSIFIDSIGCDAKTSSLGGSNYKINIGLSNVCGEDTFIGVETPARAGAGNNYGGNRSLQMGGPVTNGCSSQSRYCWRSLIRVPVEKIFTKGETLSYSAIHVYDYGGRQCWSRNFSYDFYESQTWSEGGATYYSNNNKTVGGVLGTIYIPGWGSNSCRSNVPSGTHRATALTTSLFQSRANKSKTNNGIYSKLRATCQDFSSWSFASSEYIVKSYRPTFEFNYAGSVIKFTGDSTSSLIDMGKNYNYLNAKVDFSIPTGIDFDFYLRAGKSTSPGDSTWTDWYSFRDPKGVFQNERGIGVFSGKRYFQYRLKYDTKTTGNTPNYSYLRIYYSN